MHSKVLLVLAVGLVTLGCTKEDPAVPDSNHLIIRGEVPSRDSDIIMNRETNKRAVEEFSFVGWTDGRYNLRYGDIKDRKSLPGNIPFGGEKSIEHLWELEWFSSLETIQDYEFYRCSGLRVVVLPPSVRSIGRQAFGGCYALDSLYVRGRVAPAIAGDAFDVKVPVIVVPRSAREAYDMADGWRAFREHIVEGW